jgi:hypothetical protein
MSERDYAETARFVVGMSRSGTNWVSRLLNAHPEVASFGESTFWGRGYVPPGPDGAYDRAQLDRTLKHLRGCRIGPAGDGPGALRTVTDETRSRIVAEAFEGVEPPVTPAEVFCRYCRAIAAAEGKRHWVEKTPHHVNWVDRIVAALPAARMVVMVREPYAFMLSYKHQGDRMAEDRRRLFHRLYHPLGCAMVWRGYMRSIVDGARRFPDQMLVVELDALTGSPEKLAEIQSFLELPVEPDLLARVPPSNTSFPGAERPELGADDLFWMRLVSGRTMRRAGYRPRAIAWRPVAILGSFARLPVWTFHVLKDMRTRVGGGLFRYLWRWVGGGARRAAKAPAPADGR